MNDWSSVAANATSPVDAVDDAAKRTAILVAGMHRSGTSALTRTLNLLGADLPQNVMGAGRGNSTGHWEPKLLVALHDRMLLELGSSWYDWRSLDLARLSHDRAAEFKREISQRLQDDYGASSLFVLKDPRICRFVSLYAEILQKQGVDTRFVVPVRNPLSVATSLAKRNGMTVGYAELVWLRHVLEAEFATRGKPRVILDFEELLLDWRAVASKIQSKLDIAWPVDLDSAAPEINAFLEGRPDLRPLDPRVSHEQPQLSKRVTDTYDAMKALNRQPFDGTAAAVLDEIRAELDAVTPGIENAIFPELRRLTDSTHNYRYKSETLQKTIDEQRSKAEAEAETTIALRAVVAEREATIETLREAASKGEMILELQGALKARDAEITTFQSDLSSREAELISLRAKLVQRQTELEWAQRRGQEAEDTCKEILASTSWRITAPVRKAKGAAGIVRRALETLEGREKLLIARDRFRGVVSPPLTKLALRIRRLARAGVDIAFHRLPRPLVYRLSHHFLRPKVIENGPRTIVPLAGASQGALQKVLWIVNLHDLATQHYRVQNIAAQFSEFGIQSLIVHDVAIDTALLDGVDLVVLNRILWSESVESLLAAAKAKGVPTVFDIDDLIFDPAALPFLRAIETPSRRARMLDNMQRWRKSLTSCDYVTVSTEALLLNVRALGKPAFVIPNNIDAERIARVAAARPKLTKRSGYVYVGYFSGTATHTADFAACADAVIRVLDENVNCCFVLVGLMADVTAFKRFGDRFIHLPLQHYDVMLRLVADVDIVIAPLELANPFTDAKSQLKIFEAAAFKKPYVASPTRSYLSIVVDGKNGLLAATPQEWEDKLNRLVGSESLRRAIGNQAHATILPRFMTEDVASHARAVFGSILSGNAIQQSRAPLPAPSNADTPALSIVAPLFKKSKEVCAFLDSLCYQTTQQKFEIILVDDACPENSGAKAQAFVERIKMCGIKPSFEFHLLTTGTNQGNCGARNIGLAAAKAPIVMVVDADCVFDHGSLEDHLQAYRSDICDVAVGIRGLETGSLHPLQALASARADIVGSQVNNRLQYRAAPSAFVNCVTRNFSYNRQKFPELRFDADFAYTANPASGFGWEDIDFGYRLYRSGARIHFLDQNISLHVTHEYNLDDRNKPVRSLRNFARLHAKHPELAAEAREWSTGTFDAITNWLEKFKIDTESLEDWKKTKAHLAGFNTSPYVSKSRPLRVLTHRWHCAHQYELYRLGHRFDLARNSGSRMCNDWDWGHRPMPYNSRFVPYDPARAKDYDLLILHFDENVVFPERCKGVVPPDWGNSFKNLLELSHVLPTIAVCHGTPQFRGQYDISYTEDDLWEEFEDNTAQLRTMLKDVMVVCNSHQAAREWQFAKSKVIWHGFAATDFRFGSGELPVLSMQDAKIRQRPHYNGLRHMTDVSARLPASIPISSLEFPNPPFKLSIDPMSWAHIKFQNYARTLGNYSVYLNTTVRSPMPRTRGEAMLAGSVSASIRNHDVDMFIKDGVDGFFSDHPAELADKIIYLMKDRHALDKMRLESRKTAQRYFGLDRYLREWAALIDAVRR